MKIKDYLVKDITKTDFYNIIIEACDGVKVKAYDLTYLENVRRYEDKRETLEKSHLMEHRVHFEGYGPIPWKEIEKTANDIINNTKEDETKRDTHIFHLVFNCFNNTLHAFDSWHGVIWLEDGSWVTLKCVYNSYEDDYIFKIERHKPPMISKVDFGRIPVEYTITTLNI